MRIGVIILVRDEEIHLERALASIADIADKVWVIDSGSTDRTVEIAIGRGAEVLHNKWVNHAVQLNWAIDQVEGEADWLMRLDADEYLDQELKTSIHQIPDSSDLETGVVAYELPRYTYFMSRPVRYGGVFPTHLVRLWKSGAGRCESRWMDEHIVVDGVVKRLRGKLIDDNKKPLEWWIEKHNSYSNREAVDLLLARTEVGDLGKNLNPQARFKRWFKLRVYQNLPLGMRAWLYHCYRYYFRLGWLDNEIARQFHWLQGYWYRRLVDAKILEVNLHMKSTGCSLRDAILDRLGIDIEQVK